MTTPQEKAQCVSWFIETKSDIQTQRNFTIKYAKQAPARQSIRNWHKQFMETGTLLHKPRSGRPTISEEGIERIRQSFSRSPTKSIRTASVQLQVPRSTIHKVLHKNLKLHAYKIQLLQELKPDDKAKRKEFAVNILGKMEEDDHFLNRICFSDEATFHVPGKLNKVTQEFGEAQRLMCGADFCVTKLLDHFSFSKRQ